MPNILLSKKAGYRLYLLPAAARPTSIPDRFEMTPADMWARTTWLSLAMLIAGIIPTILLMMRSAFP